MSTSKNFLFVGGTARSGTSAMATLLRAHPAIAMGRERYAWRFREGTSFNPSLFGKERFCLEYRPEDSHHARHQPYYQELYPRFDECVYVGDKLPSLYQRYDYVLETFPGCRIIYMARNVIDVAASYQGRARETARRLEAAPDADVSRLWSTERDWRSAVSEWNTAVDKTLALDIPGRLFIADYERLFTDDALLDRLCAFLELPVAPALRKHWMAGKKKRMQIEAERQPRLEETQLGEIRRLGHLEQFEQLLRRA